MTKNIITKHLLCGIRVLLLTLIYSNCNADDAVKSGDTYSIDQIQRPPQMINSSTSAPITITAPKPNYNSSGKNSSNSTAITKRNINIPTTTSAVSQRIEEERSNGVVTEIRVKNRGNIPDYYIYPSQQQNLNINNQPDKNVATPTWQISW